MSYQTMEFFNSLSNILQTIYLLYSTDIFNDVIATQTYPMWKLQIRSSRKQITLLQINPTWNTVSQFHQLSCFVFISEDILKSVKTS